MSTETAGSHTGMGFMKKGKPQKTMDCVYVFMCVQVCYVCVIMSG